eukprot:364682-Chlamydomonas_euryale.AAC.17
MTALVAHVHAQLRDIMTARIAMCAEKGFPAIDFDNVDGYANPTGFPDMSADDQIQYLTFLSDASHEAGLAVGLKNDVEQIPDLVDLFDFAINEECWQYDECNMYDAFVGAGKAVWNIEYDIGTKKLLNKICPKAAKLGIKTIKSRYALKQGGRIPCPDAASAHAYTGSTICNFQQMLITTEPGQLLGKSGQLLKHATMLYMLILYKCTSVHKCA